MIEIAAQLFGVAGMPRTGFRLGRLGRPDFTTILGPRFVRPTFLFCRAKLLAFVWGSRIQLEILAFHATASTRESATSVVIVLVHGGRAKAGLGQTHQRSHDQRGNFHCFSDDVLVWEMELLCLSFRERILPEESKTKTSGEGWTDLAVGSKFVRADDALVT